MTVARAIEISREVRVRDDEHVAVAHGPQAAKDLRVEPVVDSLEHLHPPLCGFVTRASRPVGASAGMMTPGPPRARTGVVAVRRIHASAA